MSSGELAARLPAGDVRVMDVRGRSEWISGHLPGAGNIPLGYLGQQSDQLPRDELLVVHCQSGSRSAIAASVLRSRGFAKIVNLTDGLDGWRRAGYPVEVEQPADVQDNYGNELVGQSEAWSTGLSPQGPVTGVGHSHKPL